MTADNTMMSARFRGGGASNIVNYFLIEVVACQSISHVGPTLRVNCCCKVYICCCTQLGKDYGSL